MIALKWQSPNFIVIRFVGFENQLCHVAQRASVATEEGIELLRGQHRVVTGQADEGLA